MKGDRKMGAPRVGIMVGCKGGGSMHVMPSFHMGRN